MYLNPLNSSYTSDIDILDKVETDMNIYKEHGQCFIMGDLNGHTNINCDFVLMIITVSCLMTMFQMYVCLVLIVIRDHVIHKVRWY